MDEALQHAYKADDDYLAAYVSSIYGNVLDNFGNTEKAAMFMMYSTELYEKVHHYAPVATYIVLGEILCKMREYEKSIYYSHLAIHLQTPPNEKQLFAVMRCNNNLGWDYHKMERFDSAIIYYKKALQLSSELSDQKEGRIWRGIISGNMAQIDFAQGRYKEALSLFIMDYQIANDNGMYDEAGNAIQWAAKTNLALGNKSEALGQVQESFNLLQQRPSAAMYWQNAYLTASEIFNSMGKSDSAYFYSGKYDVLHDSLERVVYQSSISVSQLHLNNEKNRYNIQNLEREKEDQSERSNYIIMGILLFSTILLLLINRQRQKLKYKRRIDQSEKIRIQGEMVSARMQLKMFTQNILEKTNLVEKLEPQIKNPVVTDREKEFIDDLCRQNILTDEDWLNFKMLFEKTHPHFFEKINKQVNNITQAEQRMAALTLLHLSSKQMAACLGISPNSVIKSKQRLRQRLGLQTDQEVETFIAKL